MSDLSITSSLRQKSNDRAPWIVMAAAVAIEAIVGFVELRAVALGRPSGWDPAHGRPVYLLHGIFGAVVAFVAIALFAATRRSPRLVRLASTFGVIGLGVAGFGGILAAYHSIRLIGMGLMFIGAGTAFFGYLIPLGGRAKRDAAA